jgi:4-amino-4-deoxy-L-arabinose transferase-like glycosyltransferase
MGDSIATTDRSLEQLWTRRFGWLLLGLFLCRALLLAISPLTLSGDEAYYWEWGRNLAWGYFSKPPFIGWWMGFAGWLGGDTTFGLRIWALIFGTFATAVLFLFGRAQFGARAAFFACLALVLSPANAALNQILTIDPPLLAAWSISLAAFWALLQTKRWAWPPALLLILGIGWGVLTKQMMLVFPVLATLYLAVEPSHRRWLRHPGWWAIVVSGFFFLLPPLYWNSQHDWITFAHTGDNLSSPSVSVGKQVGRFFEFVGAQFGLLGLLTYPLLLAVLWKVGRRWRTARPIERFLFIFSAPVLVIFFLLAMRQRALPNWPAVFYPTAYLLLGAWVAGKLSFSATARPPWKLFKAALWIGGTTMALLYVLIFTSPLLPLEKDPMERVRGWRDYGLQVAAVESEQFAEVPHSILVTGHRYNASQLAFYHPDQPKVYRWNDRQGVHSQYEIWPGPETSTSRHFLIVVPEGEAAWPEDLEGFFESISLLQTIEVPITPHTSRTFALYRGDRALPPPEELLQ